MNQYDILKERGFVFQVTDEDGIRKLFDSKQVTAYIGFDPTASSLHAGSLVPIMALAHLQRGGHRPLALVGGGTGLVGDPSGKTESRLLLTIEDVRNNAEALKKQLSQYISFDQGRGLLLNNADWLVNLNYIEFLRDIGRHFSVNKMLSAESVKLRLEKGLTFIEFNYMILQAYDFHVLSQSHDCDLQMGGQDQWGNIVSGIDLIRRMSGKEAYGVTFPLITSSSGEKFGKSVKGAVWLDSERTPPYEYYQFFRNTADADVARYLGFFTFLPMDEVRSLAQLKPPLINRAKEILAYEATRITHGEEEAKKAYLASVAKFSESDPGGTVDTSSTIVSVTGGEAASPAVEVERGSVEAGISVVDAFVLAGLAGSKGEARRLIKQGGAYVHGERIDEDSRMITLDDFSDSELELRAGKKRHMRLVLR
jgi:tyrosyl-tRNA synthetase